MKDRLVLSWSEYFFARLCYGFIFGFALAWLAMKITWLDMRMNTGIFMPAGMLFGLLLALARSIPLMKKVVGMMESISSFLLGVLSLVVLSSMLADSHAATIKVPILIKEGLSLRTVDSRFLLAAAIFIFLFGLGWAAWQLYLYARRLEKTQGENK
jgi:hypothetical protein